MAKGHLCPYCGQPRVRVLKRGKFVCWWHPVAGKLGYIRCAAQAADQVRSRQQAGEVGEVEVL